jgi:hypothetical protein
MSDSELDMSGESGLRAVKKYIKHQDNKSMPDELTTSKQGTVKHA